MDKPVHLVVHVPEVSRHVGKGQKVPVLIHVQPADADVEAELDGSTGKGVKCAVHNTQCGGFNRIVWIDQLPAKRNHTLHIRASADGFGTTHQSCNIRRDNSQNGNIRPMSSDPPSIISPTGGSTVEPTFPSYGYASPASSNVSGWLVDSNGKTWPGTTVPPWGNFDWTVTFSGIPAGNYTLYVKDLDTGVTSPGVSITVG